MGVRKTIVSRYNSRVFSQGSMGERVMLDEVAFMQARLFRMFVERTGISPVVANEIWESNDIWGFIGRCYDSLHLGSDLLALDDVFAKLSHQGVTL